MNDIDLYMRDGCVMKLREITAASSNDDGTEYAYDCSLGQVRVYTRHLMAWVVPPKETENG